MGVDALVLSFRTMFDPRTAGGLDASYELRLGEERFRAVVADGRFEIVRGEAERPDVVVEAEPAALAALVCGGRGLAGALRTGEARVEGDEEAVKRLLTLSKLPEPAAAPVVGVS